MFYQNQFPPDFHPSPANKMVGVTTYLAINRKRNVSLEEGLDIGLCYLVPILLLTPDENSCWEFRKKCFSNQTSN
jgi:hypothetical protein